MRLASVTLVAWMVSTSAFAQDQKIWADVNVGAARSAQETRTSTITQTRFQETATFEAQYFVPAGASFDFGGGYMLTPLFGVGASFMGTAHEAFPVLTIRIPHPFIFNAHGTDTGEGDTLVKRREGTVNIQAMVDLMPLRPDDEGPLRELLEGHVRWTESPVARALLDDWAAARERFTLVLPRDYQRVLDVRTEAEAQGLDLDGPEVWNRIMEASRG